MAQSVKGEAGTKILLPILENIVAVSLYLSTTATLEKHILRYSLYKAFLPLRASWMGSKLLSSAVIVHISIVWRASM